MTSRPGPHRPLLAIARRLRRDDRGIALPVVFGLAMVMMIAISASMSVAASGLVKSRNDQDWNAALAAAYAGVADYQTRLNNDSSYYIYGNPSSTFTTASGSTVTLPTGDAANPAFGVTTSDGWGSVPVGAGVSVASQFRYEVNNKTYRTDGTLKIRATGLVGSTTRSIVASLKRQGFINYLYFTDFETTDPAYTGYSQTDSNGNSVCARYVYASPTRPSSNSGNGCVEIQFGSSDVLDGPVRSNDQIYACGATFKSSVQSAGPVPVRNKSLINGQTCATSSYKSTPQGNIGSFVIPQSTTGLLAETYTNTPTTVPDPGCLYTGPTVIKLNNNGTMTVWSPWSKYTEVASDMRSGTKPSKCGTPGTSGLGSTSGQTIPVLNLNLVYVQAVPVSATDVNYTSFLTKPQNFSTCTSNSYGWSFGSLAYPIANEVQPNDALSHYGCRAGDLYVSGTLAGQMTLSAQHYIYVTDDITYNTPWDQGSTDMLGLIGEQGVFVWNPVSNRGQSLMSDSNREIDAAILSTNHTFQVLNYDQVPKGTLKVVGSIAQKFRGTVSSGGYYGYSKNYVYDTRMKSTAPPKFLAPVASTYGVSQFGEVSSGFSAAGAQQ